jgi:hypothetical protein
LTQNRLLRLNVAVSDFHQLIRRVLNDAIPALPLGHFFAQIRPHCDSAPLSTLGRKT